MQGDLLCVENLDGSIYFRVTAEGNALVSGTIGSTSAEGSSLYVADSGVVAWGGDQDIAMAWDGTRFNVTQATANSEFRWGVDGAGIDQRWYGDTASTFALWDQSRDTFALSDAARIGFGTGAGAAYDIEITWNGSALVVSQLTANSAIQWGVSGAGIDMVFYGDTAGRNSTWDQSADSQIYDDNTKIVLGTGLDFTGYHDGTNTLFTSITGNVVFDNQAATGAWFFDTGTDTSATKFAIRNNSGTELLSVTADAVLTSVCAMTTTDGVASGTARKVGGLAANITAPGTSHTNSTDEAVLASYVIPANTIKAGTLIRCRFLARVTADNGGTTLTGRLRFGTTTLTGTELVVSSAVDTSSGHIFEGEFVLIGRAAPGAAAAVVGCWSFAQPAAAGGARVTAHLGTTNFATNGALRLELTGDWSAADANAVQAEIFAVEVIG